MDILVSAFVIILAIAVAVALYYILENVIALIVNAVVAIIVLFLLNVFHVMGLGGSSDLPTDWIKALVSAIGGLGGLIIVVVLHLAGVILLVIPSMFLSYEIIRHEM
jgi:inhibitor of the pro-sigma K processing machinery